MTLEEFRVYLEDWNSQFQLLGRPDFNGLTGGVYTTIAFMLRRNSNIWIWTANPTSYTEMQGTEITFQQKYPETPMLFKIGKKHIQATKKVLERDEIIRNYIEVVSETPERIECRICHEKFDPATAEEWQNMSLMKFRVYLNDRVWQYLYYDNEPESNHSFREAYSDILRVINRDSTVWIGTANPTEYIEMQGANIVIHEHYEDANKGKMYIETLKNILAQDEIVRNYIEVLVDTPDRIECRLCYEKFDRPTFAQ
jgi:hypothetical protein